MTQKLFHATDPKGGARAHRNHEDFEELHLLIRQAQGAHPGILAVRRDNDPRRNMNPLDIVRALRNLENAGVPIANE
jgi:hypothetical protein